MGGFEVTASMCSPSQANFHRYEVDCVGEVTTLVLSLNCTLCTAGLYDEDVFAQAAIISSLRVYRNDDASTRHRHAVLIGVVRFGAVEDSR